MAITNSNRLIFAAVIIVVVALTIDTSFIKTSILTTSESGSSQRVDSFVVIISITLIGQYLILAFVKNKSKEIIRKKELRIDVIHKIVTIVQYALTAILIFIILQLVLTSQYNVNLLIAATSISYGLAVVITALLAQRFFSWYASNRNSVAFSYGFASAIFMANALVALFFVDLILYNNLPQQIVPHLGENIPFLAPGSIEAILNSAYDILSVLSFMIMWGATSLLLRRYTQRLGRVKYWIILSIPLAFFVSQFLAISLNLFAPLLTSQALFYGVFLTLIFTFSKPAGGILFGIAFWIVARNVRRSSSIVRDYMIISAYGLVLLFTSSQASVLATGPYPPFGLATASFIGLSSYLVLVGIYSSAISLAEDSKLRQSIRSIAIKESRLLDSIGMAQMEQQIQKKVIEFTKQNQARMAEESGIQSSLTEEDMKAYLEQVIREVKKDHQQQ
jgi:predicted nucleic acid-binding protein/DNA-binding protein Fis